MAASRKAEASFFFLSCHCLLSAPSRSQTGQPPSPCASWKASAGRAGPRAAARGWRWCRRPRAGPRPPCAGGRWRGRRPRTLGAVSPARRCSVPSAVSSWPAPAVAPARTRSTRVEVPVLAVERVHDLARAIVVGESRAQGGDDLHLHLGRGLVSRFSRWRRASRQAVLRGDEVLEAEDRGQPVVELGRPLVEHRAELVVATGRAGSCAAARPSRGAPASILSLPRICAVRLPLSRGSPSFQASTSAQGLGSPWSVNSAWTEACGWWRLRQPSFQILARSSQR